MVQTTPPDPFCIPASKNVQPSALSAPLPPHAILLDTLRGVEQRLQTKGMLRLTTQQQPLWFLAEQERNEFLWRRGYSLTDSSQFDFWVDLPRLVQRRISQIQAADGLRLGDSLSQGERQYLESLVQAISTVEKHLSALSRAVSLFRLEIEPPREIVLLPFP